MLHTFWNHISTLGRKDFLIIGQDRYSYDAFAQAVAAFGGRFRSTGLGVGDRLLLASANEAASIAAYVAALLDGVVPVMLASQTPAARMEAIAASVEPGLVIVDADRAAEPWTRNYRILPLAAPGAGRRPFGFRRSQLTAGIPSDERGWSPRLPTDRNGLAYVLFTSGTTQDPSGVMISRGNLAANLATIACVLGCDSDARIFNDMVLAHADGMVQGPLLALLCGGTVIRDNGFSVDRLEAWLNAVRRNRASHFITVPTVWSLIDRYAQHDDYFEAEECRHLVSVAARLDGALWQRLEARFARPLYNEYGLTETVASALYAGPDGLGTIGSIGRPIDCEARIDPQAGSGTPTVGELQLRGGNIFVGYWKNPQRSNESFTADGWMRTGDLARRHADGTYSIEGRLKTIIMSAGFLIRPDEIDEAMLRHPCVVESVTVGLDDEAFGDIAATAVVLDGTVDPVDLMTHARACLEPLKVPKHIVPVDAIPRGESGKPRLAALRDLVSRRLTEDAVLPQANREDPTQAVLDLAATVFRADRASLGPRSSVGDVAGWDSFSHISFLFAIEDRFGVKIGPAQATRLRSLGEMISFLQTRTG